MIVCKEEDWKGGPMVRQDEGEGQGRIRERSRGRKSDWTVWRWDFCRTQVE